MRKVLSAIIFVLTTPLFAASSYTSGIGLRLEAGADGNAGVSYKQFLSDRGAVEGLLLTDLNEGVELAGLYLFQGRFPSAPKTLRWYAGGGVHAGTWGKHNRFVLGPDGMLGMEYAFADAPLALSLDWHPVLNVITENSGHFHPAKFGLTIRYTF